MRFPLPRNADSSANLHIRRDADGQDIVNLKSLYIDGQRAPFTHVHYRRFAVRDIPLQDPQEFETWLYARWAEKEQLLEHFRAHGSFPAEDGYVRTRVRLQNSFELPMLVLTCGFALSAAVLIIRGIYIGLGGLGYLAARMQYMA